MISDTFDKKMKWVKGLTGDEKAAAGAVVSWDATVATVQSLIAQFNASSTVARPEQLRFFQLQVKKLVVGMIYEMDTCLDCWAGILHSQGLLTDKMTAKRKEFKTKQKVLGLDVVRDIRNGVAFHHTDFLKDPDELIRVYELVDQMSLDSLNGAHRAATECGISMQSVVVDSIS